MGLGDEIDAVPARAKKFATTAEAMIANWVQRFKRRGSFPQKVGSKPQRCERIYKRTAQAQRDFLREGAAGRTPKPHFA